jgi:hypothetical protein
MSLPVRPLHERRTDKKNARSGKDDDHYEAGPLERQDLRKRREGDANTSYYADMKASHMETTAWPGDRNAQALKQPDHVSPVSGTGVQSETGMAPGTR